MPLKPKLLEVLRCPESQGTLEDLRSDSEYGECLYCRTSARVYPVRDDLAVMMIDESTKLDTDAEAKLQGRIADSSNNGL